MQITPPGVACPAVKRLISEVRLKSGCMRQLAVRAGSVDGIGKLVRQDLGNLIDRNIEPGCELPDGIAAQNLLKLIGRNRQVLAIADPGLHLITQTGLLQFGYDRG
jgi:hypothetical protein